MIDTTVKPVPSTPIRATIATSTPIVLEVQPKAKAQSQLPPATAVRQDEDTEEITPPNQQLSVRL